MKDNVDVLVERLTKELESLATMKDKREGLVGIHGEVGQHLNALRAREHEVVRQGLAEEANEILFAHSSYAELLNEGSTADVMYLNMKTYLLGVVDHLQVYKKEKEAMLNKLHDVEKHLKTMRSGSLSLLDSTGASKRLVQDAQSAGKPAKKGRTLRSRS